MSWHSDKPYVRRGGQMKKTRHVNTQNCRTAEVDRGIRAKVHLKGRHHINKIFQQNHLKQKYLFLTTHKQPQYHS